MHGVLKRCYIPYPTAEVGIRLRTFELWKSPYGWTANSHRGDGVMVKEKYDYKVSRLNLSTLLSLGSILLFRTLLTHFHEFPFD